jgi:hypothetical protein
MAQAFTMLVSSYKKLAVPRLDDRVTLTILCY